jgi:hypothetical protein
MKLDWYGVGLSLAVTSWALIWVFLEIYWKAALDERVVFPAPSSESSQVLLHQGSTLEERWVVTKSDLTQITIYYAGIETIDTVASLTVEVSADDGWNKKVEVPVIQLEKARELMIELDSAPKKNSRVRLALNFNGPGELLLYSQDNGVLSDPPYSGRMYVEGVLSSEQLVFSVGFAGIDNLVKKNDLDYGFELKSLLLKTFLGRPNWMKLLMGVSLCLIFPLTFLVFYVIWSTVTESMTTEMKKNILWLFGVCCAATILVV